MRQYGFRKKLLKVVASTYVIADNQLATWGEQEYINAFIRQHPETFALLPCGCNYQYSGIRREAKCAGQPVVIAHGW